MTYTTYNKRRGLAGTRAPQYGTHELGEVAWNTSPVDGPTGWICTVAGTPGTWVPFGWPITSGVTGSRPTGTPVGYEYYDTTLGYPVWHDGAEAWVDATGTTA